MLRRLHHDAIIALLLAVFCIGAYWATFRFNSIALYPRALVLLLAVLAIMIFVSGILKTFQAARGESIAFTADESGFSAAGMVRPLAILVLTGLYVAILPVAGFWIVTPIFIACVAKAIGLAGVVRPLAVAFGFTGSAYLLFAWQLGVPLPQGTFL